MVIGHAGGVALAAITAIAFAGYYLCIRLGTDRGRVWDLMLVSLLVNVVLLVPLVVVVHGVPELTVAAALAFAGAGLVGSLFARLTVMKSVEAIGASRTSPIVAGNAFVASLLAIVLFEEQLTAMHLIGIVLIVAGVGAISWETSHEADPDASLHELGLSLGLPILGAVLLGVEPVFITLGLETGTAVLPGVAIGAVAATIGFLGYLISREALRPAALTWHRDMPWYIGAGVASTVGLTALYAAIETAPIVLVIPLLQTTPLIVIVLSALFMPRRLERVTWPLVAGAIVVVIGAILVSVYG